MYRQFELSVEQTCDVANAFYQAVLNLSDNTASSLQFLPNYISCKSSQGQETIYVLDIGGSNVRASLAHFENGQLIKIDPAIEARMPWQRGIRFSLDEFLKIQCDLLNRLNRSDVTTLGYCFSYPTKNQPNGDSRLVRWTKGIDIPGTENQLMGKLLTDYFSKHYGKTIQQVNLVNDSVACLLSGLSQSPVDSYLGLIAGTGANLATFFPVEQTLQAVNLESGSFAPPHLNQFDEMLDQSSDKLGHQLFEKASGGMYLAHLFNLAHPEVNLDISQGAAGLSVLFNSNLTRKIHKQCIARIYTRAAHLVAAKLAGMIKFHWIQNRSRTFRITAEGGLFWSQLTPDLKFKPLVERQVRCILQQLLVEPCSFEICKIENANLIGAAYATRNDLKVRNDA
ncbi:hexokinase family protein [Catenovulum sediminis]|uniref:Hexokinase n=1 Tax=Catenovulum sediminis TaxID=1740262 RepID=A0ABV1RD80_9ALTE